MYNVQQIFNVPFGKIEMKNLIYKYNDIMDASSFIDMYWQMGFRTKEFCTTIKTCTSFVIQHFGTLIQQKQACI